MSYNRYRILARDRFRCRYCGAAGCETKLHVDHVQPRSRGGSDDPLNLVTACQACNLSKRDAQPEWQPCSAQAALCELPELACPQDSDFQSFSDAYDIWEAQGLGAESCVAGVGA